MQKQANTYFLCNKNDEKILELKLYISAYDTLVSEAKILQQKLIPKDMPTNMAINDAVYVWLKKHEFHSTLVGYD